MTVPWEYLLSASEAAPSGNTGIEKDLAAIALPHHLPLNSQSREASRLVRNPAGKKTSLNPKRISKFRHQHMSAYAHESKPG